MNLFTATADSASGSDSTPFGFGPDYSFSPPPDYMGVRKAIMADPELKLDFHWNQTKAEDDAKRVDTKRYTDAAVLPLITADMERNQKHIDWLQSQITDFQAGMQHSYPVRKMASFSTPDAIAALAGGLLGGGDIGHSAGVIAGRNQAELDNSYQNEVNQFGLDEHRGEQIVAAARAELSQALGRQSHLEDQSYAEVGHAADQKHADLQKAMQQFQTASNPGEVDYAVQAITDAGGTPPSKEAVDEAKKAANIRYDHEQRLTATSAYAQLDNEIKMYGGSADETQRRAWQDQADKIEGLTHIPHAAIPGGPTWQKQQQQAATKYQQDHLAAEEKRWNADQTIKKSGLANQLAHWSAEHAYWRGLIQNGQDRNAVAAMKSADQPHVDAMTRQRDIAQGELNSIQGELAGIKGNLGEDRAKRKTLYAKQAGLKAKVDGYNYAIGVIQQAGESDSGETPSATPAGDAAAGDNEFKMASDALGRHPDKAAQIKSAYTARTGKPWPGG